MNGSARHAAAGDRQALERMKKRPHESDSTWQERFEEALRVYAGRQWEDPHFFTRPLSASRYTDSG